MLAAQRSSFSDPGVRQDVEKKRFTNIGWDMITGHSHIKYITGTRLSTSEGNDWDYLLAERWRHKSGSLSSVVPKSTEIAILLEGKVRVYRRGDGRVQDTVGVPGTIWLCPAGIHEEEVRVYGDMEDCMHLYIPADPISSSALQEFDVDPALVRLGYECGFQDPLIEQIGRVVMGEMVGGTPVSRLLIDSLQTALSVHLLKNYSNIPNNKTHLAKATGALDKKRLHRVEDYIVSHIDRNISLEDLAREACLSPFHFARAFKATMGVAPHQYILNRKLELAKKLIANGNMSLMQVALMTGFSNQAHFTRAFKRATGQTPGQYRAILRH